MAKIRTGTMEVHGLKELNRALREMEGGLSKELRQANKDVAEEVSHEAIGNAQGLGGVAAHVAPSIKATAGAQSASVAGGGAAHPAFGGAEFGGQGRPTTQQFQPWRGNGPSAGYFVYPAIRSVAPKLEDMYLKRIDELIRKADLD